MRRVLFAAAVYNVICSLAIAAFPRFCVALLGFELHDAALLRGFGLLLGALGVGYGVAATAPLRHWSVVLIGLTAKGLGSSLFLIGAAGGAIPWSSAWPALTNGLIWIVPFAFILATAAKAHSSEEGAPTPAPRDRLLLRYTAQDGLTLYEHSLERPLLTVFLRHGGCTFYREALADLSRLRPAIEARGAGIALVTMSEEPEAAESFARYGLRDVPRISDPACELYRAFGLARGSWRTMFSPAVWKRAFRAGILEGRGIGAPRGDTFRMPGVFLIHQGLPLESYRHSSPADRPDYLALASCERCDVAPFGRRLAIAR